jgi:hypothetical protein
MNPPELSDVDALIADFVQVVERGQPPDPEELLAQHPAHAAELALFLRDLHQFGSFLGLSMHASELTTDFRPPGVPLAHPAAETPGERFGEYDLIEVIGQRGDGQGVPRSLAGTNLAVALRQVQPGSLGAAEAARRLREEVANAAQLNHPNLNAPRPGTDRAPPGYVILVHEAFTRGERSVPYPAGAPGRVLPYDR